MKLSDIIPSLAWINQYKRSWLKGDVTAGLTVGVMLIPQGMAYAFLAGLPPIYGLYTSLVPLTIYALFGTSRQLAVGPVAIMSMLTAFGVGKLAPVGSDEFIQYVLILSLMVGVIQFSLGVFRLGFVVKFLSHPVISGFTSAAAIIIGFSQLKYLLGIDIPRTTFIHTILISAFEQIKNVNSLTLAIGLLGIFLIFSLKKWRKSFPGSLVTVILGILVVWGFGFDSDGVQIVGEVPDGLPALVAPGITLQRITALLPTALVISFIGFLESIAVAKALQSKHKDYSLDSNKELIALGVANIGGSFFQSYPAAGGFGRSAVNDQAGANTGMSSLISVLIIVLTLLLITPLFFYLPKAILASVIMVAVFGLIDFKEPVYLWRTDKKDFFMLIATFMSTLVIGIEEGILVGVILSLLLVVYQSSYPHLAELGNIPNTIYYRNIRRFHKLNLHEGVVITRFDSQLFFANSDFFKSKIDEFIHKRADKTHLLILDFAAVTSVDSSAIHMLADYFKELKGRNIEVKITSVRGPVRDRLHKGGIIEQIGRKQFYLQIHEAIMHYKNQVRNLDPDYATQYNEK